MADKDKVTVKVLKDETVHNGEGGFYAKGDVIECPSEETAQSLKDKGFAA
jgi:hypothetical protein